MTQREQVARLVDPDAWEHADALRRGGGHFIADPLPRELAAALKTQPSLATADTIIALLAPPAPNPKSGPRGTTCGKDCDCTADCEAE